MLITPHFLTGMAIASVVPEVAPAALMAITSHFVLDAIPHYDTIGGNHVNKANIILNIADVVLALLLFWWLVPLDRAGYLFLIALIAILPDIFAIPGLIWPGYYKLPVINKLHYWHTQILQYDRLHVNYFWGIFPQIIVTLLMLWLILN